MIFCIRNVSAWRWASSPAHSSQGLSGRRLPWESFSSTACVTYSRKGIPRALAVALALRKVGPGISSFVLTEPVFDIYGTVGWRDAQRIRGVGTLSFEYGNLGHRLALRIYTFSGDCQ